MADVKVAVVRTTLPTTTEGVGNFTVTIPGSPGWTPKAVKVITSQANTDDTVQTTVIFSLGFADDNGNERCNAIAARNSVVTKQTYRKNADDNIVELVSASTGSTFLEISAHTGGTGTGPVTDGWKFYCGVVTTAIARYVTFVFYGGSDLDAVVGTVTPDTTVGNTEVVTTGHATDMVFLSTVGLSTPPASAGGHALFSYGGAWNDTSPVNVGIAYANKDAIVSNTELAGLQWTDRAVGQPTWSGENWAGEVTAFSATGFTVTSRDSSPGSDHIMYLSLALSGADVWFGSLDTPTSGSTWNPTDPSFQPISAELMFSPLTSVDTISTTVDMSMTFGATDGTRYGSISTMSEDAKGASNEDVHSSGDLLKLHDGNSSSSVLLELTTVTFDGSGMTATISGTPSGTARKGWGFFLGEGAAAAGGAVSLPPPLSRNQLRHALVR